MWTKWRGKGGNREADLLCVFEKVACGWVGNGK